MSKFKVGDKVYCYLYNKINTIVEITETAPRPILVYFQKERRNLYFTIDGKEYSTHENPTLFTLDEALEKGFITHKQYVEHRPKKKKKVVIHQALMQNWEGRFDASDDFYFSEEEAIKDAKDRNGDWKFIKFLEYTATEVEI